MLNVVGSKKKSLRPRWAWLFFEVPVADISYLELCSGNLLHNERPKSRRRRTAFEISLFRKQMPTWLACPLILLGVRSCVLLWCVCLGSFLKGSTSPSFS